MFVLIVLILKNSRYIMNYNNYSIKLYHEECAIVSKYADQQLNHIQKGLNDLLEKDLRKTALHLHEGFKLPDLYSQSGFQLIVNGSRFPNNPLIYTLINNVIDITRLYTRDYSRYNKEILKDKIRMASKLNNQQLTNGRLSLLLGMREANIYRASNSFTKATCSLGELLDLNLIPNPGFFPSITNQPWYFNQIENAIMRALLADGIEPISQEKLAELTDLPLESIKHPEILCRDKNTYFEALNKILSAISPYADALLFTKKH